MLKQRRVLKFLFLCHLHGLVHMLSLKIISVGLLSMVNLEFLALNFFLLCRKVLHLDILKKKEFKCLQLSFLQTSFGFVFQKAYVLADAEVT